MAESAPSDYELAPPTNGAPAPGRPPFPFEDEGRPAPRTPPPSPPKPLPRLSRTAPLSAAEAREQALAPGSPRRSRRARASARDDSPGAERGDAPSLVEPTPMLDTVEARGRIRLALGIVAVGAVAMLVAAIVRVVGGGRDVGAIDPARSAPPAAAAPLAPREIDDREGPARDLLSRARSAATPHLARDQLRRVVDSYPDTEAASEAREALGRIAAGQAPFPEGPALAPEGPSPPAGSGSSSGIAAPDARRPSP